MKVIISIVITAVLVATAVLFVVNRSLSPYAQDRAIAELLRTARAVENEIDKTSGRIANQLQGLSDALTADREFAMKLLVERDTTAAEVTETAQQYMAAMGFDLLEITDAGGTILSSGHFSARVGGSAQQKLSLLEQGPAVITDDIRGQQVLTFQGDRTFSFGDAVFHCVGGMLLDEDFITRLAPSREVRILLQHSDGIISADTIETISQIQNNRIIINDTHYLATAVSLPSVGEEAAPKLLVVMDEPEGVSFFELLF